MAATTSLAKYWADRLKIFMIVGGVIEVVVVCCVLYLACVVPSNREVLVHQLRFVREHARGLKQGKIPGRKRRIGEKHEHPAPNWTRYVIYVSVVWHAVVGIGL